MSGARRSVPIFLENSFISNIAAARAPPEEGECHSKHRQTHRYFFFADIGWLPRVRPAAVINNTPRVVRVGVRVRLGSRVGRPDGENVAGPLKVERRGGRPGV